MQKRFYCHLNLFTHLQTREQLLGVVLLITVLLSACTAPSSPSNEVPPTHASSHLIKQPITGLVAMGNPVSALKHEDPLKEVKIHPDVYSGVVINTAWMILEPEKDLYDFSSIDDALDEIREYNAQHSEHPTYAKLRIFGGPVAPAYVKEIGGGPISVRPVRGPSVEIGLFWTVEYGNRFAALLNNLALRYDRNELLQEVCVSTAVSLTAEPFIAPLNKTSNQVLREKGFTDDLYKQALRRALDDYKVWTFTAIDFPFNVFNATDNERTPDISFTTQLMRDFRAQFVERAVISNHGLVDPLAKGAVLIYPTIKELGAPVAFQTVSPDVDFNAAINLGVDYEMTEFEMWQTKDSGGKANVSYDDLKRWTQLFSPLQTGD